MTGFDRLLERHHHHAERVVGDVRRRLAREGAPDALAALDGLSPTERYLLAQRELGAR